MKTLNRHDIRLILRWLDSALVSARAANPTPVYEDHTGWCIRQARERILEASISDVEVETVPASGVRDE